MCNSAFQATAFTTATNTILVMPASGRDVRTSTNLHTGPARIRYPKEHSKWKAHMRSCKLMPAQPASMLSCVVCAPSLWPYFHTSPHHAAETTGARGQDKRMTELTEFVLRYVPWPEEAQPSL